MRPTPASSLVITTRPPFREHASTLPWAYAAGREERRSLPVAAESRRTARALVRFTVAPSLVLTCQQEPTLIAREVDSGCATRAVLSCDHNRAPPREHAGMPACCRFDLTAGKGGSVAGCGIATNRPRPCPLHSGSLPGADMPAAELSIAMQCAKGGLTVSGPPQSALVRRRRRAPFSV
jgi:hypothetical protein